MHTQPQPGDWLEPLASLETTTNSFVVIIRSKPRPSATQTIEWHGSVEHAQSRERIHFIDYARLSEFIAARCETPLLAPWRTRLSRRWQKTALHHVLHRLIHTKVLDKIGNSISHISFGVSSHHSRRSHV